MDWMSLLGGLMGASGQDSGGMQSMGGNPYQVSAPQQQQGQGQQGGGQMPAWGQGAEAMTQGFLQQQNQQEFGTEGMPSSLQQTLAADQNQQQNATALPQANFAPYIQQGTGVLPPIQQQDVAPIQPRQQVVQAGAGAQMPSQQQYEQMQGGRPQQTGFSDLFNMTGSAPSSPNNDQGFHPNALLRLSEGYNRGGVLGALGMLLTDYK